MNINIHIYMYVHTYIYVVSRNVCMSVCLWNQKNIDACRSMFVCKHQSESPHARVRISLLICGGGQASQGVLHHLEPS